MKKISTIFFDVGGVCLTNGWDHISRQLATARFSLDYEDFENRHIPVVKKLEKGKMTLDEYLDEVVFFKKRDFAKQDFIEFMYSQSAPIRSTLKLLGRLSAEKKYLLAALNNESREVNKYRVDKFKLDKYFLCFFSSCYMEVRKPEPEIFIKALQILHKKSEECLFIDDREENYRSAVSCGINAVLLDKPENLSERLKEFNIEI